MPHVTPEFTAKLRQALSSFDAFAETRHVFRGRFLLYAGVDKPNSWDLEPSQFRNAIEEWLAQGYAVGWAAHSETLYIYAQEPDCQIPTPEQLFAEEALADTGAILKAAGFEDAP